MKSIIEILREIPRPCHCCGGDGLMGASPCGVCGGSGHIPR